MDEEKRRGLGERAVRAPGWRWLPGAVDVDGYRVLGVYADGYLAIARESEETSNNGCAPSGMTAPDLSDPATLGCLLSLVRKAWGVGVYTVKASPRFPAIEADYWVAYRDDYEVLGGGITEAEALVAALEAAPSP